MNGAIDTCSLLHRGGTAGRWGNLGLWPAADYAQACSTLARAVGDAAGLQVGDRVLTVACGAGEELRVWQQAYGAQPACGVEIDPMQVANARAAGLPVRQGSGTALHTLNLPAGTFDAVLCVDAAYHLHPRSAFLQGAWTLLRPGGRLAYTDLLLDENAPPGRALLRAAARLCGLDAGDLLMTPAAQLRRLGAAGFEATTLRRLDAEVLDGFATHVRQQSQRHGLSAWQPGWRRAAVTAWLIGPCRAAGLGYALIAARRPGMAAPGAASTGSACSLSATA